MTFSGWSKPAFWHSGETCLYIEQKEHDIGIIVLWNGGPQNRQMAIEVFLRNEKTYKIETYLKPLQEEGFSWNSDKCRYTCYFDGSGMEQDQFNLMDEKIKSLVRFINDKVISSNA